MGSQVDRAVAHARGGSQGREEGRERGYYHLHRKLDDAFLGHGLVLYKIKLKEMVMERNWSWILKEIGIIGIMFPALRDEGRRDRNPSAGWHYSHSCAPVGAQALRGVF